MHEYGNKYRKEPYDSSETRALKKDNSFKTMLVGNLAWSVPIILIFFLLSFFPFIPHSKYGFGAESPSSFSDYFRIVGKGIFAGFVFIIILTVLTTAIDFIRTWMDLMLNYKKVGVLKVLKIDDLHTSKVVYFNSGKKLKIDDSEFCLAKIKEGDVVEVQKTATNKLISLKILS